MYGMRRSIFAVILLAATTASAINTGKHPVRIGLLAAPERYADSRDERTADLVRNNLRLELRALGYDAFITGDRLQNLARDTHPAADYYLDIAGADRGGYPVAGIGVGTGRGLGAEVAVVVGSVFASLTVYDGRTLELLDTIELQKRNAAIAPTAIGFGGRSISTVIALPMVEWSQYRSATRALAHDAARQIDEALRR